MTLPEFDLQAAYMDLGWGVVAAAVVLSLLELAGARRLRPTGPLTRLLVMAVCLASMWLPAPVSPSYWLGMAFQYPSLVLVALAGFHLARLAGGNVPARGGVAMPELPAATLFALGVALYASTFAWIPLDLYAFGYGDFSGAIIATVLVLLWGWRDRASAMACAAVAIASLVHAATRLPTGNAWDVVLDPLLFAWTAAVMFRAVSRRVRARNLVTAAAP